MPICSGYKRDGSRCTATVNPPHTRCWWHDPANAERRRRAASRGGKGKAGSRALKELHALLEDLTKRVIDGELETSRGAVANKLIGTRLQLLEYERRLRACLARVRVKPFWRTGVLVGPI